MILSNGIDRNRPYTDVEVSIKVLQTIMGFQNVSGKLLGGHGNTIQVRLFTAKGVDHQEAISTLMSVIEENHG